MYVSQYGSIRHVVTKDGIELRADLYVDCSGFRAELIGKTLGSPFRSVEDKLFTNRAITCRIQYEDPNAAIESYTLATAHEAGWTWDIGLSGARGIWTEPVGETTNGPSPRLLSGISARMSVVRRKGGFAESTGSLSLQVRDHL